MTVKHNEPSTVNRVKTESVLHSKLVSEQDSWNKGELSQEKCWILFEAQKVSFESSPRWELMNVKPETQAATSRRMQSCCAMMAAQRKGWQMGR